MDRILGFQAAPPPGVPAVEPDIRGAVTIRQQLDKHRADPSCAACHQRIDPPGFALESFDVMGGWRERYRAASETAKPEPGIGLSGQHFAFHYALPVDAAGEMLGGGSFQNVREFKKLLIAKQEETVARNLVNQFVIYSTGAPAGFHRKRPAIMRWKTRKRSPSSSKAIRLPRRWRARTTRPSAAASGGSTERRRNGDTRRTRSTVWPITRGVSAWM